jgi:hypothetical protein
VEGSCEHGNEPSGSIKRKILVAVQLAASRAQLHGLSEYDFSECTECQFQIAVFNYFRVHSCYLQELLDLLGSVT